MSNLIVVIVVAVTIAIVVAVAVADVVLFVLNLVATASFEAPSESVSHIQKCLDRMCPIQLLSLLLPSL